MACSTSETQLNNSVGAVLEGAVLEDSAGTSAVETIPTESAAPSAENLDSAKADPESKELRCLKDNHAEIKKWLHDVNKKIYDIETSYLEETQLGNIVRGWELDRPLVARSRGQFDERDRLFSCSSYAAMTDQKAQREAGGSGEKERPAAADNPVNQPVVGKQIKKSKKRKAELASFWNDDIF